MESQLVRKRREPGEKQSRFRVGLGCLSWEWQPRIKRPLFSGDRDAVRGVSTRAGRTFWAERHRGGREPERHEDESARHFCKSRRSQRRPELAMPRRQHCSKGQVPLFFCARLENRKTRWKLLGWPIEERGCGPLLLRCVCDFRGWQSESLRSPLKPSGSQP